VQPRCGDRRALLGHIRPRIGVTPSIITFAKGLGNGMAIAADSRGDLWTGFPQRHLRFCLHTPLSTAAANATSTMCSPPRPSAERGELGSMLISGLRERPRAQRGREFRVMPLFSPSTWSTATGRPGRRLATRML